MQLDYLHFTNDLTTLLYSQQQMQEKTTSVAAVDLNIHKGKNKILRYNTTCNNRITLGEGLEDVKTFTCLSGITDEHGGPDAYVKTQIGKARTTYLQL
ncbi:unnamed protein product [Schistosoma mattheei]|uniref:Uncharacterized protein n=1 Tax=Schistosoma mattheei TaxID=31246 RepID=A0A183NRW9_9TREM|nr:unnamed protein product [Schistosoma mattheei]